MSNENVAQFYRCAQCDARMSADIPLCEDCRELLASDAEHQRLTAKVA